MEDGRRRGDIDFGEASCRREGARPKEARLEIKRGAYSRYHVTRTTQKD